LPSDVYPTKRAEWFAAYLKGTQSLNSPEEYNRQFDASTVTDTGCVTTAYLRDLVFDATYF